MSTIGRTNVPPSGTDTSDATAVAGEIVSGKTAYIASGKVTGTLALTGDAIAANVLSGKTFYNTDTGTKITGTMTDRGAYNITPSASNQTIPAGYHNGSGVVAGDSDLVASNIKSGVNIFGVNGTYASGGNFSQPTLFAGDLDVNTLNIKNLNYSGAGIAYVSAAYKYFGPIFFSSNIKTDSSGYVTSIDGISIYTSVLGLIGYSKTSSSLYTYTEGNQYNYMINKNISGQGCLYTNGSGFILPITIFFGTGFKINSSGYISEIDGVAQGSVRQQLMGYSKL